MSRASSTGSAYSAAKHDSKFQDTSERVLFHNIPGEIWPHSKLGLPIPIIYGSASLFSITFSHPDSSHAQAGLLYRYRTSPWYFPLRQ